MAELMSFSNFAQTTLTAVMSADSTSLPAADPSVFPSGICAAVIWGSQAASPLKDADREIVLVISDGAGSLSLVRGMEGTQARDWNSGDNVANVVTASVMNSLTASAHRLESFKAVSEDYAMTPDDTFLTVGFDQGYYPLTLTLPSAADCSGRRYTVVNTGKEINRYVNLVLSGSDVFANMTSPSIPLCGGASCVLMASGSSWVIASYTQSGHTDIKTYNDGGLVSAAEGLIYADASEGITILELETGGAQGLPLTVVRQDGSDHEVRITCGRSFYSLYGQGSSVTVVTDGAQNMAVLSEYIPALLNSVMVTDTYLMKGYEKCISADASDRSFGLVAVNASIRPGAMFTVLRKDSSVNTVYVTLNGSTSWSLPISAADGKATFLSDGSSWVRLI